MLPAAVILVSGLLLWVASSQRRIERRLDAIERYLGARPVDLERDPRR